MGNSNQNSGNINKSTVREYSISCFDLFKSNNIIHRYEDKQETKSSDKEEEGKTSLAVLSKFELPLEIDEPLFQEYDIERTFWVVKVSTRETQFQFFQTLKPVNNFIECMASALGMNYILEATLEELNDICFLHMPGNTRNTNILNYVMSMTSNTEETKAFETKEFEKELEQRNFKYDAVLAYYILVIAVKFNVDCICWFLDSNRHATAQLIIRVAGPPQGEMLIARQIAPELRFYVKTSRKP